MTVASRSDLESAGTEAPAPRSPAALPAWIAIAIIALIYVALRLNAIGIPLDRDEGAFGYGGQRILEGGIPYRDVVDHKPPGVFYIYAAALRLFPPTGSGVHAFLQLYNLLTLIAIWRLMRARFGAGNAPFWAALCYAVVSASPALQGFTASTEMFMLLPIVLSVWVAVEGLNRHRAIWLLISGACGAAAFWIKPTGLASAGFALLYLAFSDGTVRQQVQRILLWLAGAAIVSAGVAAYFYANDLLADMYYWSFIHNLVYAGQISAAQALGVWVSRVTPVLSGQIVAFGVGVTLAVWNLRRRPGDSSFVLGFLGCSLIGTLPGVPYAHYFAQLAPAIAVAAGWALAVIAEQGQTARRWLAPGLAACALIVPLAVHRDYFFEADSDVISVNVFKRNPFREAVEVSRYLADRTTAADRILIFGSEPEILVQARRASATPFVMIYPLTREYPRYREFQESVWGDIQQSEPAYVVVVDLPISALWDGKAELPILADLEELLRARYDLEAMLPIRLEKSPITVFPKGQAPDPAVMNSPETIYIYRRRAAEAP